MHKFLLNEKEVIVRFLKISDKKECMRYYKKDFYPIEKEIAFSNKSDKWIKKWFKTAIETQKKKKSFTLATILNKRIIGTFGVFKIEDKIARISIDVSKNLSERSLENIENFAKSKGVDLLVIS